MAFKPLPGSDQNSDQLDWANDVVQKNVDLVGRVWDVTKVKLRPKGLIVECNDFAGWYFKSSDEYKALIIYLERWYESKQNNPVLQIQLTDKKPYFRLGEDDERRTVMPWCLLKEDFLQFVRVDTKARGLELSLPDVPSSSELDAHEALDELSDRRASEHRQQKGKKEPPEEPPAPAIARK